MINTREIAAEYRLSHWAGVMQERAASGLSIKSYCESIGLAQNVYFYWQRKLRETAVLAPTHDEVATVPQGWSVVSAQAVCCETTPMTQEDEYIQIEIGKSRIAVHETTDQALLEKTCRMLMGLC